MPQQDVFSQLGATVVLFVMAVPFAALGAVFGMFCRSIAAAKYRDRTTWFVLGFLFGVFAAGLILLLPSLATISPASGRGERVLSTIGNVRVTSSRLIESGRSYDIARLARAVSHEDKLGQHTVVVYDLAGDHVVVIRAADLASSQQIRRAINQAIAFR